MGTTTTQTSSTSVGPIDHQAGPRQRATGVHGFHPGRGAADCGVLQSARRGVHHPSEAFRPSGVRADPTRSVSGPASEPAQDRQLSGHPAAAQVGVADYTCVWDMPQRGIPAAMACAGHILESMATGQFLRVCHVCAVRRPSGRELAARPVDKVHVVHCVSQPRDVHVPGADAAARAARGDAAICAEHRPSFVPARLQTAHDEERHHRQDH
ncbi:hypothetical protein KL951_000419 [Ogataea haglerorum]|nr:hypothetical protein KL951_000419 [Ogataea haglerorum]